MAQKYGPGVAHDRMAAGTCPECGEDPQRHSSDPRFWARPGARCDLLPSGVQERIDQYRTDIEVP